MRSYSNQQNLPLLTLHHLIASVNHAVHTSTVSGKPFLRSEIHYTVQKLESTDLVISGHAFIFWLESREYQGSPECTDMNCVFSLLGVKYGSFLGIIIINLKECL